MITLKQAIDAAGGIKAVAREIGVSTTAVWKWTRRGLPRTEWTGETSYAETICRMARERSAIAPDEIAPGAAQYARDQA